MKRPAATLLVGSALILGSGLARAQSPTPTPASCLSNARADYFTCATRCRDDYIAARLACRNVRPACGEACLAGRQACLDQVDAILATGDLPDGSALANCSGGTDACKATFRAARQQCIAASCPSGQTCTACQPSDQTCTDCVDQAQVTDFLCRDACRDSWQTNATVMSMQEGCPGGFRSCVAACPPLE
jgi:hypothetical protein